MLRTISVDLRKIFSVRGFIYSIIAVAALCFFVEVYTDTTNGKAYSAAEALFSLDREFMRSNMSFAPPVVLENALTGYSAMLLPVTASFAFVFALAAERDSGNMRFSVTRSGRLKSYFSKFVTAIFSGGLCTAAGVAVFGLFAYILFPNGQAPEALAQTLPEGAAAAFFKKLLTSFAYGAVSTLPAFFLCSFCKNPYIVLCLPFSLTFVTDTLLTKIEINRLSEGDYEVFERLSPYHTNSVCSLFYLPTGKTFYITLAVNTAAALAAFIGFVIIMEKRVDKGR